MENCVVDLKSQLILERSSAMRLLNLRMLRNRDFYVQFWWNIRRLEARKEEKSKNENESLQYFV